jgi:putative oxidoreductase
VHIGLLIIRVVVGLVLAGHGTQKLFGWWGGHGLEATGRFFHAIGHRPGRQLAGVAGLMETGGGLLLACGLVTPLAAAAVMGTMTVAGASHRAKGLWNSNGGFELPLTFGTVAAGLAFTGGGALSLDAAFGLHWGGWRWGVGMLALATAMSLLVLSRSAHTLRRDRAGAAYPAESVAGDPEVAGERTQRLPMP